MVDQQNQKSKTQLTSESCVSNFHVVYHNMNSPSQNLDLLSWSWSQLTISECWWTALIDQNLIYNISLFVALNYNIRIWTCFLNWFYRLKVRFKSWLLSCDPDLSPDNLVLISQDLDYHRLIIIIYLVIFTYQVLIEFLHSCDLVNLRLVILLIFSSYNPDLVSHIPDLVTSNLVFSSLPGWNGLL